MLTYSIFNEMMDLRNLIDDFFTDAPAARGEYPGAAIYEGADDLEVRLVVPGMKNDDLSIHLADNTLVVEGEKKDETTEGRYLRRERAFGKFRKTIPMPFRVDADSIEAVLKNGILTVRLRKSEDAKPKRIAIN